MAASNIILALDALTSVMNTATRLQSAIGQAVGEDRDMTPQELADAGVKTDELVDRVNQEL